MTTEDDFKNKVFQILSKRRGIPNADSLYSSILTLLTNAKDQGLSQKIAYQILHSLYLEFENLISEEDSDDLLSLLDVVSCFCPPNKYIWPHSTFDSIND